jgi:uncharacterized protein Yka (UPF0111/DUF47 family)
MEKLTQEELQELQEVLRQYEDASFRVGQYTMEIENMKGERRKLIQLAEKSLESRTTMQKQLEEKYGSDVKINPLTGEIVR